MKETPQTLVRRRRARRAARAVAAALPALLAFAPAATAGVGAKPHAGVEVGESYGAVAIAGNLVPGESVPERTEAYRRLRQAGVRAVRIDINWAAVEPEGEPLADYDFAERDREVRAIRRAGLKVIGILAYGHPDYSTVGGGVEETPIENGFPPFGLGSSRSFPPDDPNDFARYARATADHFERAFPGTMLAWEVWNEENQGYRFWAPREDPEAYADLLCATYPELRAVVGRTPIVFGGMFFPAVAGQPGMGAPEFLQRAYDHNPELGRCYDVMAYHPYPYPFTAPELDVPVRGSVLSAYDQMREVLGRNGDAHKPLWITEVGWPTHDRSYGVPERKQAQYAARMQAASFAQGVPLLTWYTYGDAADPSGFNQESWFGFFRPDGSPKPAYRALRTFHGVFQGTRFGADLSERLGLPPGGENTGGRGFALRYVRGGARGLTRITALWLACEAASDGQNSGGEPCGGGGSPLEVEVRLPVRSEGARVVGLLGERRRVAAEGGVISIAAGPDPVYVLDRRGPAPG